MGNCAAPATKRQRTCIACGTKDDKLRLLRIVRDGNGVVSLDETGRAAGRGAYVCGAKCLQAAFTSKKLPRALRCKIEDDDYKRIAAQLQSSGGQDAKEEER